MSLDNPYASPEVSPGPHAPDQGPEGAPSIKALALKWIFLSYINSVFPALLGGEISKDVLKGTPEWQIWPQMMIGVAIVGVALFSLDVATIRAGRRSYSKALTHGAVLKALLQFLLIVEIAVGTISIKIVTSLPWEGGIIGVLLATIICGAGLAGAAFILGAMLNGLISAISGRRAARMAQGTSMQTPE